MSKGDFEIFRKMIGKVQDYNYEAAAQGIIAALNHCGVVEPSMDVKSLQSDK